MIVTIKPKNGKPIKKKFSDSKEAIEWINSTTAELATQQSVEQTFCKVCGASIVPNSNMCVVCGN